VQSDVSLNSHRSIIIVLKTVFPKGEIQTYCNANCGQQTQPLLRDAEQRLLLSICETGSSAAVGTMPHRL